MKTAIINNRRSTEDGWPGYERRLLTRDDNGNRCLLFAGQQGKCKDLVKLHSAAKATARRSEFYYLSIIEVK